MLGFVGVALEIARGIFLIHPVQCAQDILCDSGLVTKVAVRRMIGMIILDTIGTNILPGDLLVFSRLYSPSWHYVSPYLFRFRFLASLAIFRFLFSFSLFFSKPCDAPW